MKDKDIELMLCPALLGFQSTTTFYSINYADKNPLLAINQHNKTENNNPR